MNTIREQALKINVAQYIHSIHAIFLEQGWKKDICYKNFDKSLEL